MKTRVIDMTGFAPLRRAWAIRKMDEIDALNQTIKRLTETWEA